MHSKLLKVVVAVVIACAMCCVACAAAKTVKTPNAAKTEKAPKVDKKFDQKAVLMELWNAPGSTVVGSVDGVKVTKDELLKLMWLWEAPNQLQNLLTRKLIEQNAKKQGIVVSDKDVQEKMQESLKQTQMGSVDQLLDQYKLTWYHFHDINRTNTLAEKTVAKNQKVSDAEYAEWIHARLILIRPPVDEKDKTKQKEIAKKKADEVYAKLKAGEDFGKLAEEYPDGRAFAGPEGAKGGGDLGWISKGKMPTDFDKVAFTLKAGEFSEPVDTRFGYQIIKVDKLGKDASPAEKAMLKSMIMDRKIQAEIGPWYQSLIGKSKIDNKLMAPVVNKPQPVTQVKPPARPKPQQQPAPPPTPPASGQKPAEPSTEKPDSPPPPPPPPAQ